MNDNAKAWVAALRSGEYQQTGGALRYDGGYCCLGVACDLYRKHKGLQWVGDSFLGEELTLPLVVQEWLGLNTRDGVYTIGGDSAFALDRNNDTGQTFLDIAAIIESEPDGLFR